MAHLSAAFLASPSRPVALAPRPSAVPAAAPPRATEAPPSGAFGAGAVLASAAASAAAAAKSRRAGLAGRTARRQAPSAKSELPKVDRSTTKIFRKEMQKSDAYFRFGKSQMDKAMDQLRDVSGSDLVTRMRKGGFRLTVGDVTFVLAESYGFCWGVERSVAMAYEARNYFPDKKIWATNEIIHNQEVNQNLRSMGIHFVPVDTEGNKDFSGVQEGDVVLFPAFGTSVDEMALLKERRVQIVDTTCPWVSKVWNSVEKTKDKGHTALIHGKYNHEETIATKSLAETYLVVKDMEEAEYVAQYILGNGDREDFLRKFAKAMSEGFDPDVDLDRVGVANQTTMLKGETELIGKLFERTLIKRHGPHNIDKHFVSFNTICDATQERQDAMYKMFDAKYEPPLSKLYAELEGEQVGVELQSAKNAQQLQSRKKEDAARGATEGSSAKAQQKVDLCLVLGGYNSSNTTHLLEIAEEEGVPAYHIDCAERISRYGGAGANTIEHKPLATAPAQAMLDEGLEVLEGFLPEGPVVIGITSGASTPDNTVGDAMKRVLAIRGLTA